MLAGGRAAFSHEDIKLLPHCARNDMISEGIQDDLRSRQARTALNQIGIKAGGFKFTCSAVGAPLD